MRELSLHILDIIQNSIAAEADLIELNIIEDHEVDELVIEIIDNGSGMDHATQTQVVDPFVTSRTTREVGLGLPLFKEAAEQCGGSFELESKVDEGTALKAVFQQSHIDRAPLGDIVGTIISFLVSNPNLNLIYQHQVDGQEFTFDTREVKEKLGEVEINSPDVIAWLKEYLTEGLRQIRR